MALCFVTSLVLGLLPAIRSSRSSVIDALKSDASGGGRRVAAFLVAVLAGIPSARRAAAVQPMVAMRAE